MISVLAALAITGVIAAALAAVYENMANLMVRSNLMSEVENLDSFIRGVVSNPVRCQYAMRNDATVGAASLVWSTPGVNSAANEMVVNYIRIYNGTGNISVAATSQGSGKWINPNNIRGLFVNKIYLRPRDTDGDGVGNGSTTPVTAVMRAPPGSTTAEAYQQYTSTELVLDIGVPAGVSVHGGVFRPIVIPLVVYRRVSTGSVDYCESQDLNTQAVICTALNSITNCSGPPPFGKTCSPIYYVSGVDAQGRPVCTCSQNCVSVGGSGGSGSGGPFSGGN